MICMRDFRAICPFAPIQCQELCNLTSCFSISWFRSMWETEKWGLHNNYTTLVSPSIHTWALLHAQTESPLCFPQLYLPGNFMTYCSSLYTRKGLTYLYMIASIVPCVERVMPFDKPILVYEDNQAYKLLQKSKTYSTTTWESGILNVYTSDHSADFLFKKSPLIKISCTRWNKWVNIYKNKCVKTYRWSSRWLWSVGKICIYTWNDVTW